MLYRHVFDKISTEFRGISRVFVNFAALLLLEISEALYLWAASFTFYKLATKNLHLATIFLRLVATRRPEDFFNFEPWRRLPNDRKVKNLTRLEFVLTFVKTGQWECFIHNVVTWYYDSFESHTFNSYSLCNQLIDLFRDLVSVVLRYKINARQKTYLGFSAL